MTDLDEKLSALIDDYRDDPADTTLDEVIADVNLQYRMQRYQMIGETMRHELPETIDTDFHSTVMARVRAEATAAGTRSQTSSSVASGRSSILSWVTLKPFAGLAVAATVAVLTVALWQPLQQGPGNLDDGLVSADQLRVEQLASQQIQGGAVPVSTNVQVSGMRWKVESESPALQQKLNAYLVNHTEYSNSVQGLIPQARVAGFDTQQ